MVILGTRLRPCHKVGGEWFCGCFTSELVQYSSVRCGVGGPVVSVGTKAGLVFACCWLLVQVTLAEAASRLNAEVVTEFSQDGKDGTKQRNPFM